MDLTIFDINSLVASPSPAYLHFCILKSHIAPSFPYRAFYTHFLLHTISWFPCSGHRKESGLLSLNHNMNLELNQLSIRNSHTPTLNHTLPILFN